MLPLNINIFRKKLYICRIISSKKAFKKLHNSDKVTEIESHREISFMHNSFATRHIYKDCDVMKIEHYQWEAAESLLQTYCHKDNN